MSVHYCSHVWSKVLISNYSESERVFRTMRITGPGAARRPDSHLAVIWSGMDFLREAMPFGQQPAYLFRDSDGIDGEEVARFLVGTETEEIKTTLANAYCERLIGSLRRRCLNFLIPMNERHLREILKEYKFKGPCGCKP